MLKRTRYGMCLEKLKEDLFKLDDDEKKDRSRKKLMLIGAK